MSQFSLGLCSVSFRKHTPEEILGEMQKTGLDRIEWGGDIHAPSNNLPRLKQLAQLQKDYGFTCTSYGTYFVVGTNSVDELLSCIEAANILGTSVLRLWAGKKNSEDFSEKEKKIFFEECQNLSKIAKKENVTLCMECHNKTYTNRRQSALELMQAVDSPHVRMYWQPNPFSTLEENLSSARVLSPYTQNIHLFHWIGKSKFPLGDGSTIWKQYLKCFRGEKNLLLEFMPDGRLESLKRETDSARELLNTLQ